MTRYEQRTVRSRETYAVTPNIIVYCEAEWQAERKGKRTNLIFDGKRARDSPRRPHSLHCNRSYANISPNSTFERQHRGREREKKKKRREGREGSGSGTCTIPIRGLPRGYLGAAWTEISGLKSMVVDLLVTLACCRFADWN